MPAWTPAPYALPYIATNDVLEQTPATNKAQMEKISEYLAHVAGMTPLGTIIPWALPFEAPGDPAYSNVPDLYLPCTGVVYPRTRAPELCAAIGHTFVDGDPDVGDVGDYVSGAALNKHHGSGYENDGIYKRTATDFDLVEADGFCTPDLRGRSPIGDGTSLPQTPVNPAYAYARLGVRGGDWRLVNHYHTCLGPSVYDPGGENKWGIAASAGGFGNLNAYTQVSIGDAANIVGAGNNPGMDPLHPSTGVNFLIACGVSGSATPSTRSGEVHHLHSVTSAHMIRQRLADPSLSDEEREALEEQLASLS